MTCSRFRRAINAALFTARAAAVFLMAIAALLAAYSSAQASLNNGEPAIDILGEFTSPSSDTTADYVKACPNNGASPLGFDDPSGLAIDPTWHRLFVMDNFNNRILVFTLTSGNLLSSKTAANVLGEPDFVTCSGDNLSASSLAFNNDPARGGMVFDSVNNRLFVLDTNESRVLVFNTSTITNNMNASYELGCTDFIGDGCGGTTQSKLNTGADYSGGLALDSTNQLLYVGDTQNNRVIVFNVAPGSIASGENASYVLGQSSFTTATHHTTQSGLYSPAGVALDPVNYLLYVADFTNNRVMVFPAYGNAGWAGSDENASYVLGQSSFTTATAHTTQSGLSEPYSLAFDSTNNRLFVGDYNNSRVMVFNTSAISNNMNASSELGCTDFTGDGCGGPTQSGISGTAGLAYDSTNSLLYVSDLSGNAEIGNNRVMIFNVAVTAPTASSPTQSGQDACAIAGASSGALYCWGYNGDGEDGLGNTTQNYKTPQKVDLATNWTVVSQSDPGNLGDYDACGLAGGALYCWGQNANGELGLGNTTQFTAPQQVGTDTTWTAVVAAAPDTCGIDNGKLYCWGINTDGEDGQGNNTPYTTPQQVGSATNWTAVSGIGTDTCGIAGGNLYCWGWNAKEELGIGNFTEQTVPQQVVLPGPTTGLVGWWKFTDGSGTAATDSTVNGNGGTLENGGTWITTGPEGGGLTLASASNQYVGVADAPFRLSGSWTVSEWVNPASLPASGSVSIPLDKDNTGACTNYALSLDNGNIGPGGVGWAISFNVAGACTTNYYAKYVTTPTLGTWYLVTGVYDSSAQTLTLYVNGASVASQSVTGHSPDAAGGAQLLLGEESSATAFNGSIDDARVYNVALNSTQVAALYSANTATWTAVSQGEFDTCGITGGALYCWGFNQYGEDGTGGATSSTVFATSTTYTGNFGATAAAAITAANADCAARATAAGLSGTYLAWLASIKNGSAGANDPFTTFVQSIFPYKEVDGTVVATSWTKLVSGTLTHAITLNESGGTVSGDVWSNVATTGKASTNGSSTSKNCASWTNGAADTGNFGVIGSATASWTFLTADTATCSTAESLYCFQQNANPAVNTTPQQVGSDTTWTAISIKNDGSDPAGACGIDNGTLYCWGQNTYGALGLGNTTTYTTPQQVGTDTTWTAISYGGDDTCGIDNGKLYCWGYNGYGEDGQANNNTSYTTPQLVNGIGNLGSGEEATDLLGEYNSPSSTATVEWTQNGPNNGPTALGMIGPQGVALDPVNHQLFVADDGNSRMMVYALNTDNSIPTSSGGHTATYVIGQTNLQGGNTGSYAQNGLQWPTGLAVDTVNNRLFVADSGNSRVTVFSTPITGNGPNAINVLGDAVYGYIADSCTQSTMSNPTDVAYDSVNQNLYVVDIDCNRVLVFNVPPGFTNGENASYEFGQASGGSEFTTSGTATSQSGMSGPSGLAYDPVNSRLFVNDQNNNRVLVFGTASLSDGPNATNVIGQTGFSTNTAVNNSATGLDEPSGVAYDANNNRLFVANCEGTDVLVYNAGPSVLPANTARASFVLGAPTFAGTAGGTTQSAMDLCQGAYEQPTPLKYDPGSGRLFVTDEYNNRVMIFEGSAISTNMQQFLMPGYE